MPQAGNFKIDSENVSDKSAVVVKVQGDIDAHTTKVLQATIGELFAAKNYRLILDLSQVNYMSSAGASLFIVIQQEAQAKSGALVLAHMKPAVRHVFDLLGLTPLFKIVPDRKAALEII